MTADFEASELGTKQYWDHIYQRDLKNFSDFGDSGEIWFGEDTEQRVLNWILENIEPSGSILDLGCGYFLINDSRNAHFLILLAEEGYINLSGMDYSSYAIDLAKKAAADYEIDLQTADILSSELVVEKHYDVIIDKGTFDAICLMPSEQDPQEREQKVISQYQNSLKKLLKKDGLFIITSCNWTEEELCQHFSFMKVFAKIKHSSFQFGGVQGQTTATVVFHNQ